MTAITLADLNRLALEALGQLPPETPITVTVAAGDLVKVLERRTHSGAVIITTDEAASAFGYTEDRWRRWAASGRIEGAYQHADGAPWRLPRAGCERLLAQLRGDRAAKKSKHRPRGPRRRAAPGVLPTRRGDIVPIDAGHSKRAS